jgi:hypothetical protein
MIQQVLLERPIVIQFLKKPLLRKPKVHHRILQMGHILKQFISAHIKTIYLHSSITTLKSTSWYSKRRISKRFSKRNAVCLLAFQMSTTCPAHLSSIDTGNLVLSLSSEDEKSTSPQSGSLQSVTNLWNSHQKFAFKDSRHLLLSRRNALRNKGRWRFWIELYHTFLSLF